MKSVIIGRNGLKYADNGGGTVNTALSPNQLANGAIGVYGLNDVDSATAGNTDRFVLITDTAAGAGLTAKGVFAGEYIVICQGDAQSESGFIMSPPIRLAECTARGNTYLQATSQETYIGYNSAGLSGTLNINGLPDAGDEMGVKVQRKEQGAYETVIDSYSIVLYQDEDVYDSISRLVDEMNKNQMNSGSTYAGDFFRAKVVSDGAVAATSGQNVTVTHNSTAVSIALADAVWATGNYLDLDGDLYLLVSVTGTNGVLDRPYSGASGTIAAASVDEITIVDYPTSGYTQIGIHIDFLDVDNTYDDQNPKWMVSVFGTIKNATIENEVEAEPGRGEAYNVRKAELEALANRGAIPTAHVEFLQDNYRGNKQLPQLTVESDGHYDSYVFTYINEGMDATSHQPRARSRHQIAVFLEVPAPVAPARTSVGNGDTAGDAQSDFEDIMTALVSTTPQLAA